MDTTLPTPADRKLLARGALTVKRAVAFSGICRVELFELMREGQLKWFYHGRVRLIPRKALALYVAGLYAAHRRAAEAGTLVVPRVGRHKTGGR